jgi:hypothetical protein
LNDGGINASAWSVLLTYGQSVLGDIFSELIAMSNLIQDDNKPRITTTEHKIGKITYQVVAAYNETATDTAKQKIERMIQRECARLVK